MATKRIKDLTSTATAADLLSSRYGVLDTPIPLYYDGTNPLTTDNQGNV